MTQLTRTAAYGTAPAILGNALLAYYKENDAKRAEMLPRLTGLIENIYDGFYTPLEKDVLVAQLNLYASKASEYGLAPVVAKLKEENKGDFTAYVNDAVATSIFATKESVTAFMNNPKPETIS